jgi:hypothetical protein
VLTYSIGQALPEGAHLAVTITDEAGRTVRRMEDRDVLPGDVGLHRVAWNLRGEAPAGAQGGRGRGGAPEPRPTEAEDDEEQEQEAQAGGGQRGQAQGPVVVAGRYRATLTRIAGETATPLGQPQAFSVIPLPR